MPSATFSSSGTWPVPANFVPGSLQVYATGEGGVGGDASNGVHSGGGGGGGAVGGETNLGGVTAGVTTLTITIGTGGTGTDTTVTGGSVTVTGAHGGNASGNTAGNGGAAGSNTVAKAGGNGGSGVGGTSFGGSGGGGSAGSTGGGGTGGAGTTSAGGTAGTAGTGAAGPPSLAGAAGGAGGGPSADGSNGIAPGSGGGGGGSNFSNHTGGTGAAGQVIIIWSVITISPQGYAGFTGRAAAVKKTTTAVKGYAGFAGGARRIAVVNQWAISSAQPSTFGNMPPALQSSVITLTPAASVGSGSGYPSAGNWLFCAAGWNQAGLPASTVSDGDDIHSWWRPAVSAAAAGDILDESGADIEDEGGGDLLDETGITAAAVSVSTASGAARTSVWYTPNLARAAGDVYTAPNGIQAGIAVTVIEVSGLGPWDTVTGVDSNYAAAATSLNLALAAPSAEAFILAAVCGDSDAVGQALTPAGWTALSTVTATNGSDHTCDAVLTAACTTTSGAVSVTATGSGSDLSGVIIGVLASAPSPIPVTSSVAPGWASRTICEFAPGYGFQSPPDQIQWVTLSDSAAAPGTVRRLWSWADKAAIPWGLSQYQAASGTTQLDNFDGNLSPSNPGGIWYSTALNANMSFQSGVAPWTAQDNTTLAQSSAQAYASAPDASALYSLQVTPDGITATPGAVSEDVTAAAGSVYSASAWFWSAAGWTSGAQVAIRWLNGSGGTISTSTATALAIPAATWTQVTLLAQTAPAGTAGARIITQFAGTPASSAPFFVAEAALVTGSSAVTTGLLASGVPVRLRLALGTIAGITYDRWYVISRNVNSYPEKRTPKSYRGYVEAAITDAWSVASASCPAPYRGEVEQDNPGWWWPCDDQPLSGGVQPTSLRNAAKGSSTVLSIVPSPNGVTGQDLYSAAGYEGGSAGTDLTAAAISGGADQSAFPSVAIYQAGAASGWMWGDPSSSPQSAQTGNPVTAQPGSAAWQQTGALGNTGAHGWFLAAEDTYPSLTAGVTAVGWFNYPFLGSATDQNTGSANYVAAAQPYCPLTLLELATATAPVAILQLDISGHLNLITYNGGTGTSHAIYTASDLRCGSWLHVAVTLTGTAWQVYVNGGLTATVTGTATISPTSWSWFLANGDLGSAGGSTLTAIQHGGNVSVSHLKIYPQVLPAWRIYAHYAAAVTGFGLLPAPTALSSSTTENGGPTGFTPDGQEYQGSYGVAGAGITSWTFCGLAAAVAGPYTSGPSVRTVQAGFGKQPGSSYGAAVWMGWTALAPLVKVFTAASADAETEAAAYLGSGGSFTAGYGSGATGNGVCHVSAGTGASPADGAVGAR